MHKTEPIRIMKLAGPFLPHIYGGRTKLTPSLHSMKGNMRRQ